MQYLQTFGALVSGIFVILIAWSNLKPRSRIYAKLLLRKWLTVFEFAIVILYGVWLNIAFLINNKPISRGEVILLIIANIELTLIVGIGLLLYALGDAMDARNSRLKIMQDQLNELKQR